MTSRHEVDKIVRIPQFKDSDRHQSEERDSILDTLEGIESKFYLSCQRMNDAFRLLSREIQKGTETEEVIEVSTSSVVECSLDQMGLQDTEELCKRDNQKRKTIAPSFDRGIDQETIVPTTSSEIECSLDHMGLQDTEDLCERDNQKRKNIESSFDRGIDQETIVPTTSSEIECSLDHMGLQDTEDLCERDNQKRKNIESSFDRGIDQETIVPTTSSEIECSLDHMGLQDTEDLCEMDIQQRKNTESLFERTTRVVKSVKTEHVGRMDIQKPTMVQRREIEEKIVQLERMMDRKFHRILNAFQQTIEKAQQQDKM